MELFRDFSNYLWQILPLAFMPLIIFASIYFFQKEKIYRYPAQGWLDIKKHPIPEDIKYFIATDGKRVDVLYTITWGPYGEVVFYKYDKTYIKYWQPLPDAP